MGLVLGSANETSHGGVQRCWQHVREPVFGDGAGTDFPRQDKSLLMKDAHRIIAQTLQSQPVEQRLAYLWCLQPKDIVPEMHDFMDNPCEAIVDTTECEQLAAEVLSVWRTTNPMPPNSTPN